MIRKTMRTSGRHEEGEEEKKVKEIERRKET